jgi:hypothetical protein
MNIYITKDNEQFLKNIGVSMSGLINTLLNEYRVEHTQIAPRHKEIPVDILNQGSNRRYGGDSPIDNVTLARPNQFVPKPPDPELGYPCCQKKSPCKHWVWDSNNINWVNSLTAKTREE